MRDMNIFTTEHPLVAQPSDFDPKEHPLLSCFRQVLIVALIFFAVYGGIMLWAFLSPVNDEFSNTNSIEDAILFVVGFPVFYIMQGDGVAQLSLIGIIVNSIEVAVDGLFWSFVGVSLYRLLRWWIQRRRFMPPNKSLQPTATVPPVLTKT
jgi:hypothetical protein